MTLNVDMVYNKFVDLNAICNFVVHTFFVRSFRGPNIRFNSHVLNFSNDLGHRHGLYQSYRSQRDL